jgi:TBC1 domain family member 8/9
VLHKPSIGRYTKLEEPRARESLLTPTLRRTMSKSSLAESSTTTLTTTTTASTLTVDTTLETKGVPPPAPNVPSLSSMPMIQAMNAAAALMERTPFAIDDAKDDDDEDEDELGISDNDDQVMDEVSFLFFPLSFRAIRFIFYISFFKVDAFLEAHDSGLTDADKKVADGKLCYRVQ